MPALDKNVVSLTQYAKKLRGGSQSILARASDGHTYVVKFANNLQGPNLLFNESAGSELYRACGLPVPEWRPLMVSEDFLDENTNCWMETEHGRLRPASGLCFGSRYLGEGGKRILEILPASSFKRVRHRTNFWLAWLIDICAEHCDNRQAIFMEDSDGWLDACFVDLGHMFGGPKADLRRKFTVSRYLDPRIYSDVQSEQLQEFVTVVEASNAEGTWQRVRAIPSEWKSVSALKVFERCLQRLTNSGLVRNVLDTITRAPERDLDSNAETHEDERMGTFEVLRIGVQGAGFRGGCAKSSACP